MFSEKDLTEQLKVSMSNLKVLSAILYDVN